ncbi:hypothetical protein [Mycolicibacterium sp. ELW1-p]|uniref:hypothetical protein n=1 Tax=Mycolicibacterium sp. ELW1-p TaxID=3434945 RepID=UPI003D8143D8
MAFQITPKPTASAARVRRRPVRPVPELRSYSTTSRLRIPGLGGICDETSRILSGRQLQARERCAPRGIITVPSGTVTASAVLAPLFPELTPWLALWRNSISVVCGTVS